MLTRTYFEMSVIFIIWLSLCNLIAAVDLHIVQAVDILWLLSESWDVIIGF